LKTAVGKPVLLARNDFIRQATSSSITKLAVVVALPVVVLGGVGASATLRRRNLSEAYDARVP